MLLLFPMIFLLLFSSIERAYPSKTARHAFTILFVWKLFQIVITKVRCIILTVSNTYIDAGGYAHE